MHIRIFTSLTLLVLVACQSEASRADDPSAPTTPRYGSGSRLWLAKGEDGEVKVVRTSASGGSEPRVMELWLKTNNVARIAHSELGDALTASSKDLAVQSKGNGLFRVLAFSSSNVAPIGAGELATLELERASDGPMRVEILTDRPMFAPREAQKGLMVGDPIEL